MTAADNQRPGHTTAKSAQPLTHHPQHDHSTPAAPETATTAQRAYPPTQPLATYIRHVVDTAPRPNPEQLTRLAGGGIVLTAGPTYAVTHRCGGGHQPSRDS